MVSTQRHTVRRFHGCKGALVFPPFPPAWCLHAGAWQPGACCGSLPGAGGGQEAIAQANARQKGRSGQGPLSDEVEGCEVTQTL